MLEVFYNSLILILYEKLQLVKPGLWPQIKILPPEVTYPGVAHCSNISSTSGFLRPLKHTPTTPKVLPYLEFLCIVCVLARYPQDSLKLNPYFKRTKFSLISTLSSLHHPHIGYTLICFRLLTSLFYSIAFITNHIIYVFSIA